LDAELLEFLIVNTVFPDGWQSLSFPYLRLRRDFSGDSPS
jgi:hypothetical protein